MHVPQWCFTGPRKMSGRSGSRDWRRRKETRWRRWVVRNLQEKRRGRSRKCSLIVVTRNREFIIEIILIYHICKNVLCFCIAVLRFISLLWKIANLNWYYYYYVVISSDQWSSTTQVHWLQWKHLCYRHTFRTQKVQACVIFWLSYSNYDHDQRIILKMQQQHNSAK